MISSPKNSSNIDASQIDSSSLLEREFPARVKLRIFVSRKAHETVWNHAEESLPADLSVSAINEVGGFLVGTVCRDPEGPFLEITAAIKAEHTRNEATQLTFTPETWEQINRVKDREYPDQRIVGWYHTHPRFGIFLSERDQFIQRSFFSFPWAVALVVDPVRLTEGFFSWSEGEPRLVSEYWVGDEKRDRTFAGRIEDRKQAYERFLPHQKPQTESSGVTRASFALATVLGFLALLLLFGFVYVREVRHSETEKLVFDALDSQKQALGQAHSEVAEIRQQLSRSAMQTREEREKIALKLQQIGNNLQQVARLTGELQRQVSDHQQVIERIPMLNPAAGSGNPPQTPPVGETK